MLSYNARQVIRHKYTTLVLEGMLIIAFISSFTNASRKFYELCTSPVLVDKDKNLGQVGIYYVWLFADFYVKGKK